MKKKKREKINSKKEQKRKEWMLTNYMQELENNFMLLDCHFDLREYMTISGNGCYEIIMDDILKNLNCSKCSHFTKECEGKHLTGHEILDCLNKSEHRNCYLGLSEDSIFNI